jgi:predicted extracellular nuclease
VTRIHEIQGSGSASATGTFTIDGIVVGDYQTQGSGQLRGFFVQEEDADADTNSATSEGIFVFCSTCPVAVGVGDRVQVTGVSSEFNNMTQLTAATVAGVAVISQRNPLPAAASIQLPVPGVPTDNLVAARAVIDAYFEQSEGMLVSFPDTLSVSEYFEIARYGHVILREGGRPHTYTAASTPTASGFIANQIDLATRAVILDDTDNRENRATDVPNTPYYHPVPGLSTSNFFRGGDTISNLTGVLHWSFAGGGSPNTWRIRPVTEAYSYAFTPMNARPAPPTVDGSLKVASFNVLNYFLTLDTTNTCAPTQDQDCRGADSAQELARQRTKMLEALKKIDADVFGFMEMENTPGVEPLADIVAGLPGYDYIDTGVIGTDAIRVGIIFKTSTVRPIGEHTILDSSVDPRFVDTRNRPALAQAFEEIATGGRLTVVVNHLKSKGSDCGPGDDDTTTGQGNCNGTRTLAAQALADWLETDPTGSGDADVLIIGDLNSYAKEDPIVALQDAGYADLVAQFGGPSAYGYVFDGQLGYLDHALANGSLAPQVTDVEEWHINADEIPLFDYNDDERTADEATFEEESDVLPLYEPNEFRTSDHDPVIVGLDLDLDNVAPVADDQEISTDEDTAVAVELTASDGDSASVTYSVVDQPANGTLSGTAPNLTYTPDSNFTGTDSFTFKANDGFSDSNVATVTISVNPVNDAPVAVGDAATTRKNDMVLIDVLANDSDVDGDGLTIVSWTRGATGNVKLANGLLQYSPKEGFRGTDSFSYTISDGNGGTATATVTVTVTK